MAASEPIQSSRLAALQQQIEDEGQGALAAFWHEVAAQGTPLIEPIAGDQRQMLVTFLWRAAEPVENVVVVGGLAGRGFDPMAQLPMTDLWFKTYRARADTRTIYHLTPNDTLMPYNQDPDFGARTELWKRDSLNPHMYPYWGTEGASLLALPAAPAQPWLIVQPDRPAGLLDIQSFASARLGNQRDVWIYTPPGYTPEGPPYRLLILFDGWDYTHMVPTPTILDNLLAEGRLPPLVTVLIGNVDRLRELSCHPPFADALAHELLPWVRQRYHVSSDPADTIIGGSSSGALAAAFAGLRYPQLFGAILAMSGAFDWKPDGDTEYEWLAHQYVESPTLPLRFYITVGQLESRAPFMDGPDFVITNRHLRDVLRAKGYPVDYAETSGGHDPINWRGALADGLLTLIGS
jgi:enterochelin esterase family protein